MELGPKWRRLGTVVCAVLAGIGSVIVLEVILFAGLFAWFGGINNDNDFAAAGALIICGVSLVILHIPGWVIGFFVYFRLN